MGSESQNRGLGGFGSLLQSRDGQQGSLGEFDLTQIPAPRNSPPQGRKQGGETETWSEAPPFLLAQAVGQVSGSTDKLANNCAIHELVAPTFQSHEAPSSIGDDFMSESTEREPAPEASKPANQSSQQDYSDAPAFLLADYAGKSFNSVEMKLSGSTDQMVNDGRYSVHQLVGSMEDMLAPSQQLPSAVLKSREESQSLQYLRSREESAALGLQYMKSREESGNLGFSFLRSREDSGNLGGLAFLRSREDSNLPVALQAQQSGGINMSISGSTEGVESFLEKVKTEKIEAEAAQAAAAAAAAIATAVPLAAVPSLQPAVKQAPAAKAKNPRVEEAVEDAQVQERANRGQPEHLEGSGSHVKYRPEMQKKARQGQEHWSRQLKEIRVQWEARQDCTEDKEFNRQVQLCAELQIKSQHECLLRTLQMSLKDGFIEANTKAMPFHEDPDHSFLGWTGFKVKAEKAQEFKKQIEALFPSPLQENTLHTALRRTGMTPEKWGSGWCGMVPFRFSRETRVQYAGR
mmetsp:Transcript_12267/g.19320  ORF Transcript_12267/g.19320 Transcript_12267/m.19320 type:complete len:519 (-) Transcript_12267:297-1853(-)